MYGKVKQLRERGQRLHDRDIAQAPFVQGDVRVFGVGGSTVAEVTDPNSQVGESLFPRLYDARLIGMQSTKLLFKGEERPQGDGGPAYVQEWSVVIEQK
jgi:hypothetical protein